METIDQKVQRIFIRAIDGTIIPIEALDFLLAAAAQVAEDMWFRSEEESVNLLKKTVDEVVANPILALQE